MKLFLQVSALSALLLVLMATSVTAQYPPREDVMWARDVAGATINMDGMLNEALWSQAESLYVNYGSDPNGSQGLLPTSASRPEFQPEAITDPTRATVKFLVDGDDLWLGFMMPDSSVGGTQDWARWDAILMSVKDRASTGRPTPPLEFFYTWWYVNVDSLVVPGAPPRFIGTYGNFGDTTRTPAQRAVWDARTHVQGMSNDDSQPDQYWSVEMRINLDSLGYDVNKPGGEIVELNFSIWDQDWVFGNDPLRVSSTRSWWQSPWGNVNADNVGRVHVRSDVTVNSGAVPAVSPDWVVENGDNHPTPTIDGALDEQVWLEADSFVIRWNDSALRNSYPGAGPWRSGQFQPDLDTIPGLPPVLDSADAAIKMFFRDDWLYLGANVNDRLVQGVDIGSFDRIDGVRFIVGDRDAVDGDNRMLFRMLLAMFDANGNPSPQEYLQVMLDSTNSEFSIAPKGATTINNNSDVDEGFVVEMKLDLTYLGYPSGLGDNLLFMGVMLADGDSFTNPDNDYGTRTWWFREHNNGPAAAWMVMDPNSPVGIGDNTVVSIPETIELHGNYPNPFNPTTTIRYSTPIAGKVSLQVYNVLGQEVVKINSGKETAGSHELNFNAQSLSSGIYFYKIQVENPASGKLLNSKIAKMILLK